MNGWLGVLKAVDVLLAATEEPRAIPRYSAEEKAAIWKAFDNTARAWEGQFADAVYLALDEDERELLALLDAQSRQTRRAKAGPQWTWHQFQTQAEEYLAKAGDQWRAKLVPKMYGIVKAQGEQWATRLGLKFNVVDLEAVEHFQQYTLTFADPITQGSREALADLLATAQLEGWGVDKTRGALGKLFTQWKTGAIDPVDLTFVDKRWRVYRKEIIARTETMRASNTGNFALFEAWAVPHKGWLATMDGRTRPSHAAAGASYKEGGNPGPIARSQPFLVGGYQMMHPHDMSLGAPLSEVAQCRCSLLPIGDVEDSPDYLPPPPPPLQPEPEPVLPEGPATIVEVDPVVLNPYPLDKPAPGWAQQYGHSYGPASFKGPGGWKLKQTGDSIYAYNKYWPVASVKLPLGADDADSIKIFAKRMTHWVEEHREGSTYVPAHKLPPGQVPAPPPPKPPKAPKPPKTPAPAGPPRPPGYPAKKPDEAVVLDHNAPAPPPHLLHVVGKASLKHYPGDDWAPGFAPLYNHALDAASPEWWLDCLPNQKVTKVWSKTPDGAPNEKWVLANHGKKLGTTAELEKFNKQLSHWVNDHMVGGPKFPATGTPTPAPAPVPAPPPTPPPAAPPPTNAGREVDLLNTPLPFETAKLRALPTHLAGAHRKTLYADDQGNKWLFKPEETSGWAEYFGYQVLRAVNPTMTPEVYVVNMGGEVGTIQRMFDDVVAPVRLDGLASLTAEQIRQIQRHHVVDWFISQHDTNDGAMLLSRTGDVYAVDKGQALKFLGQDRLDWRYKPNPNEIVYNRLAEEYLAGHVTLDRTAIEPVLDRLTNLQGGDLVRWLSPYTQVAVRRGLISSQTAVWDQILARQRTLRADFKRYYDDLEAEYLRRHPQAAPPPPAPAPVSRAGAITPLDDAFVARVHEAGWAGQSVMVSGAVVENGNLLAYTMRDGQKTVLFVEGKIRPEGDAKILTKLGSPQVASAAPAANYDPLWGAILPAVKHVGAHLTPGSTHYDGVVSEAKVGGLVNAATKLDTLGDVHQKAHYAKVLWDLTGLPYDVLKQLSPADLAAKLQTKWAGGYGGKNWEMYDPAKHAPQTVTPTPTPANGTFVPRPVTPYQLNRNIVDGRLVRDSGTLTLQGQAAFDVDLGDGVTATYIAQGDGNAYSKMGRLTLRLEDWRGTAGELAGVVEKIKRLGIDFDLATAEDMELLYLAKMGHAAKVEDDLDYRQEVTNRLDPSLSVRERIDLHLAYWNKRLGVPDVRQLPTYQPQPSFDRAYVDNKPDGEGGWAWWKRFDLDANQVKADMGNIGLAHSLSHGDPETFLKQVLEGGNGWAACTEERYRCGLQGRAGQNWGMSAAADQGTGGANYFFTRIRAKASWASYNLVFDGDLLRRLDQISYDSDKFGRADPQTQATRYVDTAGWKHCQRQGSSETIIKNGLALDHLVRISASNDAHRDRILALLRAHGIYNLGGRRIEDVVVAK